MKMRSPKLERAGTRSNKMWYPYYAGYATGFVEDVITELGLPRGSVILDPWNGSGTTTFVARKMGYSAKGFDINPALVMVARGRNLDRADIPSIRPLTAEIIEKFSRTSRKAKSNTKDFLTLWFSDNTARNIRSLEKIIQNLFVDENQYISLFEQKSFDNISNLSAFYYVALFRTVRTFLTEYKTTNPTWIKHRKSNQSPITLAPEKIQHEFRRSTIQLSRHIQRMSVTQPDNNIETIVDVQASDKLLLQDSSVDAVISSPPYCTRIDYAIATLPELAILGCKDRTALRALRNTMVGTPTIGSEGIEPNESWGEMCNQFLNTVWSHKSKASQKYYHKYFCQYFDLLFVSMAQLHRVLRTSGQCALVVQDSYYKELHNDLAAIVTEMASVFDWRLKDRHDFKISHTMAGRHKFSREYRTDFSATESLLIFERP